MAAGESKFPITVTGLEYPDHEGVPKKGAWSPPRFSGEPGDFVKIRPCAKEYGGKTYLGVLVGDIDRSISVRHRKTDGVLIVRTTLGNPAILVPALKTVIFGYESWWGLIETEADLREITDADINGVWYVKALDALTAKAQSE